MAGKSNYLEDKVLSWALKGAVMGTAPAAVYAALHNGDPLDTAAGGAEVTTTVRAAGRVVAAFGTITTNAAANTVANTGIVDFGAAAGAATFTHFALWDAASLGNMLYANALTGGSQTVAVGTNVSFAVGALVVTEE